MTASPAAFDFLPDQDRPRPTTIPPHQESARDAQSQESRAALDSVFRACRRRSIPQTWLRRVQKISTRVFASSPLLPAEMAAQKILVPVPREPPPAPRAASPSSQAPACRLQNNQSEFASTHFERSSAMRLAG